MFHSFCQRKYVFVAFLLYCLAFLVRFLAADSSIIQADEFHWVYRSKLILANLFGEDPLNATTHLGQPGVTPAIIMAIAQYIFKFLEESFAVDISGITQLHMCRFAVIVVSSLIVPIVFLGTRLFLDTKLAFLTSLLLVFDPRLIAYSRIAHLDAIQAVLVSLVVFLYLFGLHKNQNKYRILAGVFWGLALATKPTSVFLVIAFLLYRFCQWFINRHKDIKYKIIDIYDLLSLFVGHVVFALLYTRLWHYPSEYSDRLQITSLLADVFLLVGGFLNQLSIIFIPVVLLLLLLLVRYKKEYNLLSILLIFIFITFTLFPEIYVNIIHFWTWSIGLSSEVHKSFGAFQEAEPFGYLFLIGTILPDIALIGLPLGLGFILLGKQDNKNYATLFFFLLIPLVWILCLNTSAKQSWRYVLPILPFIYLIVSYGWLSLSKLISVKLEKFVLIIIVLIQAFSAWKVHPNYQLYFNYISGGLKGVEERLQSHEDADIEPVVDFLVKQTECKEVDYCNIMNFGEHRSYKFLIKRKYPEEDTMKYRLNYYKPYETDYVIFKDSERLKQQTSIWHPVLSMEPVFTHSVDGVDLIHIVKVPDHDFAEPIAIGLGKAFSFTGRKLLRKQGVAVVTNSENHKPGHIIFTPGYNTAPGKYFLSVKVDFRRKDDKSYDPNTPVLDLVINKCQKLIRVSDLLYSKDKRFEVSCNLSGVNKTQPQVIWKGDVSVMVSEAYFGAVKK